MTFSISALVLARDSHIKPDSEAGGLIWVEGWYQGRYGKFHVIIFLSHINVLVQIDIVWYIFETKLETKIFASWTKATLLKNYFRNYCADTGSWIRGQIRTYEGKYVYMPRICPEGKKPTLTFSYYWTCKNEHIYIYIVSDNFWIKTITQIPDVSAITAFFIGITITYT
jgi:hypothetical protein